MANEKKIIGKAEFNGKTIYFTEDQIVPAEPMVNSPHVAYKITDSDGQRYLISDKYITWSSNIQTVRMTKEESQVQKSIMNLIMVCSQFCNKTDEYEKMGNEFLKLCLTERSLDLKDAEIIDFDCEENLIRYRLFK